MFHPHGCDDRAGPQLATRCILEVRSGGDTGPLVEGHSTSLKESHQLGHLGHKQHGVSWEVGKESENSPEDSSGAYPPLILLTGSNSDGGGGRLTD